MTEDQQFLPDFERSRPFLRWLGRKTQLLSELLGRLPRTFGTYHEPFLGSGTLYFAMRPPRAELSDINVRLVRTFTAVRDDVAAVIDRLSTMPRSEDQYNRMRRAAIDDSVDADVAAWMIYLNRSAFNGVYRVNKSGRFNVPRDTSADRVICDRPTLRRCSDALASARFHACDFEHTRFRAAPGDFVYCDPPYPDSDGPTFREYDRQTFTWDDQRRLHAMAIDLKRKNINVLISSAANHAVIDLYRDDFVIDVVRVRRLVSANVRGRRTVEELLIR